MSFKFFPILQTLERKAVFFERKKEAKKREFLLVSFSKCCSFRFRDYTIWRSFQYNMFLIDVTVGYVPAIGELTDFICMCRSGLEYGVSGCPLSRGSLGCLLLCPLLPFCLQKNSRLPIVRHIVQEWCIYMRWCSPLVCGRACADCQKR